MKDQYRTISEASEGIYKDRGSRFLAFAFPVKSEKEVKEHLNRIKKEHHQCNHHCYAFRLRPDGSTFRSSDDREPAGSAGKPILNQILSHELTNIVIIVARYFGGSLLGVPGLIHAYRSAAADAIAHSNVITKTVTTTFRLTFPYSCQKEIISLLQKIKHTIVAEQYGGGIQIDIEVPASESAQLSVISNGACRELKITTIS